jgi:hypothetical protein
MQAYKETTAWDNPSTPNHTYLLDGNNLIAYIKEGESEPFYFTNPIKGFDRRGRKFVELTVDPFDAKPTYNLRKVEGSKGAVYWVNDDDHTCSCPGFQFRSSCKHIKETA